MIFFFKDTATTEIYTLSLHDALPIFIGPSITNGATIPSWRSPTTRVMVFQWPWGTDPTNRSPRGQRPRSLTKLVLVRYFHEVPQQSEIKPLADDGCSLKCLSVALRQPVHARKNETLDGRGHRVR